MNMLRISAGSGRHAVTAAVLAAALAALAPSGAWALPIPTSPTPDSAVRKPGSASLQVENDNWLDVHVYMVRSGQPISLGVVTGPGKSVLDLPPEATLPGADVQILALLIGGSGAYLSEPIYVDPGNVVDLTIMNDLPLSTVTVWPGRR